MINIREISKTFGDTRALENVTLDIPDACIYGFIGPDGAGKTTLFRIITSLMIPDNGQVLINGLDPVKEFKKIRKFIGYMPGRFSLYPDLTVEENLSFYATVFGTTISENYHLIKGVYSQIEPFKKRLARNLSGGMKQKLALSCALVHSPDYLVLDEPTTGVDAVSRKEFWELLNGLRNKGMTILVSTPYMDEAGLCDEIALIHKGRILEKDTPKAIINGFRKRIYAISTSNMIELIHDLKQYDNDASSYLFGQYIHYSSQHEPDRNRLKEYLKTKGHDRIKIEAIDPTIEDVFIDAIPATEVAKEKTIR